MIGRKYWRSREINPRRHPQLLELPIEFFGCWSDRGRTIPLCPRPMRFLLNVPAFYDEYLLPRLNSSSIDPVPITWPIFAGGETWDADLDYLECRFYELYSLSSNLMEAVEDRYEGTSCGTLYEDVVLGGTLLDRHINYAFVYVPNREPFDSNLAWTKSRSLRSHYSRGPYKSTSHEDG